MARRAASRTPRHAPPRNRADADAPAGSPLGHLIREARRARHLSQEDLAREVRDLNVASVSQSTISALETGKQPIMNASTLSALIKVLKPDLATTTKLTQLTGIETGREDAGTELFGRLTTLLSQVNDRSADRRVVAKFVAGCLDAALAYVESGKHADRAEWQQSFDSLRSIDTNRSPLDGYVALRRAHADYNLGDFEAANHVVRTQKLLDSEDQELAALAKGLDGLIKLRLHDFDHAQRVLEDSEQSLTRAGGQSATTGDYRAALERAWARKRIGQLHVAAGNLVEARRALEDSLKLFELLEEDHPAGQAEARQGRIASHYLLGWLHQVESQRAVSRTEESGKPRDESAGEDSAVLAVGHHLGGLRLAIADGSTWRQMQGYLYLAEDCHKLRFIHDRMPLREVAEATSLRLSEAPSGAADVYVLLEPQLRLGQDLAERARALSVQLGDRSTRGRIFLCRARLALKLIAWSDHTGNDKEVTKWLYAAKDNLVAAEDAENAIRIPRRESDSSSGTESPGESPERRSPIWLERLAYVWKAQGELYLRMEQPTESLAYSIAALISLKWFKERTPQLINVNHDLDRHIHHIQLKYQSSPFRREDAATDKLCLRVSEIMKRPVSEDEVIQQLESLTFGATEATVASDSGLA